MPAASRQSMMRNLYADEPLDCPDGRRRKWWSLTGSNRRHPACKAGALPAELRPRKGFPCEARAAVRSSRQPDPMVGPGRLELPTSRLSGVRSNHLSYGPAWKATHRNNRPQASPIGHRLTRARLATSSAEERETKTACPAILDLMEQTRIGPIVLRDPRVPREKH